MATVVPAPARQPFGVLDSSKLRGLQSVKNRQNGMGSPKESVELLLIVGKAMRASPQPMSSLKRRLFTLDHSDSENTDPNVLPKSKRTWTDLDDDNAKPSKHSLVIIPAPMTTFPTSSMLSSQLDKPRLNTKIASSASTPAAAGRSPTRSKRNAILPRRRVSSNAPFRRLDASSLGRKRQTLSITAALNGTLAHKKAKQVKTLEESRPKSWFFDIYEEPEYQQQYTVREWTMTAAAGILDISDEESEAKVGAERGKENIPPFDVPISTSVSPQTSLNFPTSAKDVMTDEPRMPLSDLNPANYYAEGCDATSVILVPADSEQDGTLDIDDALCNEPPQQFVSIDHGNPEPVEQLSTAELSALIAGTAPLVDIATDSNRNADSEPSEIEIWESESSKDEAEKNVEDGIFAV